MKIILIFLFFVFNSCTAANFDSSYLIFIGSSYSDYQNLSINSNFASVIGTKYFNPSKLSVLILTGWGVNYNGEMANTVVNAFLTRPEYNIIYADWSRYANIANYATAVDAIPEVAQNYVQQLNQLKSRGYDLTKFYAIGHSLGANLAGKIGELLVKQNILLPRITGLDPAGPLFTLPVIYTVLGVKFTVPGNNLLMKGNAKFVDIIHTDAGAAGTNTPSGDLDFWPNGGKTQPLCAGCGSVRLLNAISCTSCEHSASWRYYAESVRSAFPNFKSLRCPTKVQYADKKLGTFQKISIIDLELKA